MPTPDKEIAPGTLDEASRGLQKCSPSSTRFQVIQVAEECALKSLDPCNGCYTDRRLVSRRLGLARPHGHPAPAPSSAGPNAPAKSYRH